MDIKCAHTELIDVDLLIPNPKNPNKHPENQIKLLAKIMKHQGWRSPIVVSNRSGFIVKGHGRLQAARLNKWTQAPVDKQDYANEADEYADMVADNKIAELSETDLIMVNEGALELPPDFDLELLGIPDFEIIDTEELEPGCDDDAIPEYVEPKTKLGDIYTLGNHRLMCGDSTSIDAVEKLMGGMTAELCFTSPPYSDQREYNGEKELSTKHLATFIRSSINNVKLYAVNLGLSRKENEINQYWDDYIEEAKSCELKFLSWNVWNRQGSGLSVGNATAMFPIEHEFIFVFGERKEVNKIVPNKSAGRVEKHTTNRQADGSTTKAHTKVVSDKRALGTVIHLNTEMDRSFKHPAMFPVAFPETYIEALTRVGDHVFEPFGGSGTTAIACEKTNRKCFMMELDPHYCDVIVARWEKYTGKKAELVNV